MEKKLKREQRKLSRRALLAKRDGVSLYEAKNYQKQKIKVARLQYKAYWYGRKIIKVDKWFPSSQICSGCKHIDGKKSLKIREWTCPVCHTHHDRDINASINILIEGLRIHSLA